MYYKHHHRKKSKGTLKITTLIIFFVVAGIVIYLNKSSLHVINDSFIEKKPINPTVSTTTPKVTKPVAVVSVPKKPLDNPYIKVSPDSVSQGDPAIITVEGLTSLSNVKSFTYNNRPLIFFMYDGYVVAFIGIDLNSEVGTFPLTLTLKDGNQIKGEFIVNKRAEDRRQFDIPEKLGGNTSESVKELISTLAKEGKVINAVFTGNEMLWKEKFRIPLDGSVIIEDVYGYTRIINNFTMPHKGLDLVAPKGTPVYSMNKGVVRLTDNFRNYGNTVVIDHGLGLQTVYMHLSEIKTVVGKTVEKGELLGLSGDTGYALSPHLHLSVRVWDVSIDPMKFLDLFGE
jgi:murein DD-endopeptidase MepM/ murein hydrolase activator NlpD